MTDNLEGFASAWSALRAWERSKISDFTSSMLISSPREVAAGCDGRGFDEEGLVAGSWKTMELLQIRLAVLENKEGKSS